jgi:hypothetical protein
MLDAQKVEADFGAAQAILDAYEENSSLFVLRENGDYSKDLIKLSGEIGYTADKIFALKDRVDYYSDVRKSDPSYADYFKD